MVEMRAARTPWPVTVTRWGVFLLGCANVWRAYGLAYQSDLLVDLGASPSPAIPLTLAAVWAGLFFGLTIALWRRREMTRWWLPLSVALYGAYRMFALFVLILEPVAQQAWLVRLLPLLALSCFAAWALNRPASAGFWRRAVSRT